MYTIGGVRFWVSDIHKRSRQPKILSIVYFFFGFNYIVRGSHIVIFLSAPCIEWDIIKLNREYNEQDKREFTNLSVNGLEGSIIFFKKKEQIVFYRDINNLI